MPVQPTATSAAVRHPADESGEKPTLAGRASAVTAPAAFLRTLSVLVTMVAILHIGAFPAQAGQAKLSWKAPTTYSDGTPFTGSAGYKIHIGNTSSSYDRHINVGKVTTFVVKNLKAGRTYYFAVTAYDSSGVESAYSAEVKKTISHRGKVRKKRTPPNEQSS